MRSQPCELWLPGEQESFDGPMAFGLNEVSNQSPPGTRCRIAVKIEKQILSRRSRTWRAAQANPSRFALPSVDRDRSRRSLRQAPRFGPREPRDPGLPFRLAPENFERAMLRKRKTLRSIWLGRVREPRTSMPLYARSLPSAGRALLNGRSPPTSWTSFSHPYCITRLMFIREHHVREGRREYACDLEKSTHEAR
jgi:hypothetical protein